MRTIPGYSTVLDEAIHPRTEQDELPRSSSGGGATASPAPHSTVRHLYATDPTPVALREALADVMTRNHRLGEHLALIEMLLAVGPVVRDAGALEEALAVLDAMEQGMTDSISALREAHGTVGNS